ncbi:MAG: acetate/propionate family kinase [Oxalobacteraceae bacterium]
MAILAVNAGSSSLKFSLHPLAEGEVQAPVLTGNIDGLEPSGSPQMRWTYQGQRESRPLNSGQPASTDAFSRALDELRLLLSKELPLPSLQAVAHRVVHGGARFIQSVVVTTAVLDELEKLNSLAPLHQPHNLAGIRAFAEAFAGVPQIACFDTAFHASAPQLHQQFALPSAMEREGIRRYGFHGLSYQYIIGALEAHSTRAQGRVLMAHLGNGASLCAAYEGQSIASTMGFSALDGLMMGTRSGAIDPGVLLYCLEQGWDHRRIEHLLYKESGLLGVSGISADMRTLRASDQAAARAAIDLFTHRVVRESGAMIACLRGLDLIAFSGGIGEHDAELREQVCTAWHWLGVRIDHNKNRAATGEWATPVHQPESSIEIWVVPTDEGRVAAREAAALIKGRHRQ